MVKLTSIERDELERAVDDFIKKPKSFEKGITNDLITLGIEPSVDTILSMYCGMIMGLFGSKHPNGARDFLDEMLLILERRAWEIRQAVIKERLK